MSESASHTGAKRPAPQCWGLFDAAYWGAMAGLMAALAHGLYHIFFTESLPENRLPQILFDTFGYTAGGALLLTIIAGIRNQVVQAD